MRIWARLRHDNVVTLLGYIQELEGPGLVSILHPHGNVLSFLVKNPSVNREVIVRFHPYAFTRISASSHTELGVYSAPMLR
jgi:hypothetical protein